MGLKNNVAMIPESVSLSFLKKGKYYYNTVARSLFYTYPSLYKQPIPTFLYACLFLDTSRDAIF